MAGFIGQWGPREEQLHPRGFHGRFIRKFNIPELLPRVLRAMDRTFKQRKFQSQGQASQYLFNSAKPGRFGNGSHYRRLHYDFDEANAHLQAGDIDPSTQRYVDMMEQNAVELDSDITVAQTFTPEALGLTPEEMGVPGGDFNGLTGAVLADRGYSAVHIGESPDHGPGKITLTIAVPGRREGDEPRPGTKVIIPGRSRDDSGLFLDRDQNILITRAEPDGRGGWYMMAVALPKQDSEPNVPNHDAPRGAGLTPEQREAAIGEPQAPARPTDRPPVGAGQQITPEDVAQPPAAQPAAAPTPAPAPPGSGQGPAPRNEPIHREAVGGNGDAAGKTATDIAEAPAQPEPAQAPPSPAPAPDPDLERVRQRAQARGRFKQMARAVPVAQAMQEVDELDHKKASPQVMAQHIRAIATDPSMDEVSKDHKEDLVRRLNTAADHFENGKPNQGRAEIARIARDAGLTRTSKAGDTVDFDPATMDSTSDIPDGGQVEVIRPAVVHEDDSGKETVISKAMVRGTGAGPRAPGEGGGGVVPEGEVTPEVPAVPEVAPVKAARKAAGSKFTPDQERRLIDRAAQWRGQERNDEERRIVAEADKILARDKKKAAPTPVREPRAGRAPMAKKAAPAAPAPANKEAPRLGNKDLREADDKVKKAQNELQEAEARLERVDFETDDYDIVANEVQHLRNERDQAEQDRADLRDAIRKQNAAPEPTPEKKAVAKKAAPEAPAHPERAQRAERRAAEAPAKKAPAKKATPNSFERELEAGVQRDHDTVNGWLKDSGVDAADLSDVERTGLLIMAGNLEKKRLSKVEAGRQLRARGKKFDPIADLIDGTKAKRDKETARKAGIEERAAARAAKKAATPAAKKAEAKDLTPEQRAAAEVQDRADEAGLPGSVAGLRAAAKEQGIRGFSTMRKEQLQRALLGEDVSTGTTKLQVVSPEKMVGHLERVDTDSAARTLLDKHTLKDLKALADKLEIDHKERKLTTKDKLKNAILEKVRGTPGTDFEPVSPDEAVSIRDINVPDGPDGDMLRRGLVEVDDTDPASLRDESERLESHATQLRQRGDRVNAGLYQEASDRMGMRAQQISGMEEVPKPAKRAPRKAAAPKKRTAAEVRALIGPKLTDELLQAAGDHERQRKDALRLMEGLAKANPDSGVGRVAKKAAADLRGEAPAAAPAKKAAKAAVPKATPLSTQDFLKRYHITSEHPDFRNPPSRDEVEAQLAPMRRAQLVEIAKELKVPGASSKTMPELRGDIREATVGHRLDSIATRGFRGATPFTDEVPSSRPAEEVARATERATKAVAPGSVPGARAQAPISNPERARSFMDAMAEAGLPDRGARPAQISIDEVARNISEGHYSPEEGIRRLETDIDLNKLDLAEMEAQLRGDLTVQDRASIRKEHGLLKEDIVVQEKAVKFIRGHVRKEPEITPAEAKAALDPEQQSWLANADPEEVREGARLQGLGEVKGDTAEEVFENALRKIVERELATREAKKATAVKKAAKKALPKAEPKLDPDNPDRLDVHQIGLGIEFRTEDQVLLQDVQRRLDAGESPESIGKNLDGSSALSPRAQRAIFMDLTDMDIRIHDAKEQKMSPDYIRGLEQERVRIQGNFDRLEAQAKRQEELGRRLQAMRRPAKKAATPAAGPKPSKELSPLANGTRRKSMTNVEVGDLVRAASGAQGERATPKRVTSVERTGSRITITREDGSKISGAPQTTVWLGEAGAPEAPAPTKARRVGPGGSSFPADMPAEERARRVAQIEKRQAPAKAAPAKRTKWEVSRNKSAGVNNYASEAGLITEFVPDKRGEPRAYRAYKPNEGGKANFTSLQAAKDWLEGRDTETPGEFEPGQVVPEVEAAKKETAQVQARLLTTAMERLEVARTEAQVREAVKGLTMPELKVVAGKYPLGNVGRSKESLTKALVDFHTSKTNMEAPSTGAAIPAGRFSDKPTISNNWETASGDVAFHDDGPVGQALKGLGQDAKLEVDGDSLENVVGKLATRSVRGQISSEQFIEDLKRIHARLPEGKAKQQLGSAIREIDTPKRDPLPLPDGTPAPMVELMDMLSGIPLARQAPRGRRESVMDELQKIAQELASGERMRGGPDTAMEQRLYNTIHESYGAEGKFEIDRAVRRAIDEMRQSRRRPG